MRARRPFVAVLTALVVVLGAAACGSSTDAPSDDKSKPAATEEAAPDEEATEEAADDENADDEAAGDEDPMAAAIQKAMEGATSVSFSMTTTMDGTAITESGDMIFGDSPAYHIAMPDMGMDMILVDGVSYVSMGELSGGMYWKYAADDPNNPFAGSEDSLDPTGALGDMDNFDATFTKSSDPAEVLDGVSCQPYAIETTVGSETVSYTMWIGEDNLVRKYAMSYAGSDITATYTNWNGGQQITPPPADQVTDAPAS